MSVEDDIKKAVSANAGHVGGIPSKEKVSSTDLYEKVRADVHGSLIEAYLRLSYPNGFANGKPFHWSVTNARIVDIIDQWLAQIPQR